MQASPHKENKLHVYKLPNALKAPANADSHLNDYNNYQHL
jgi:hypothetical protein